MTAVASGVVAPVFADADLGIAVTLIVPVVIGGASGGDFQHGVGRFANGPDAVGIVVPDNHGPDNLSVATKYSKYCLANSNGATKPGIRTKTFSSKSLLYLSVALTAAGRLHLFERRQARRLLPISLRHIRMDIVDPLTG